MNYPGQKTPSKSNSDSQSLFPFGQPFGNKDNSKNSQGTTNALDQFGKYNPSGSPQSGVSAKLPERKQSGPQGKPGKGQFNYQQKGDVEHESNIEKTNSLQTQRLSRIESQNQPGTISDAIPVGLPGLPGRVAGNPVQGQFISEQGNQRQRNEYQQNQQNVESQGKLGGTGKGGDQFGFQGQRGQYNEKDNYQNKNSFEKQRVNINSPEPPSRPEQGQTGLVLPSGRPGKKDKKPGNDKQYRIIPETNPDDQLTQSVTPTSITPSNPNPRIGAIGVQPPHSSNGHTTTTTPVGPDPKACPCYIVDSNNATSQTTTSTTSTPLIGQLGFIPVIFVPYCPGGDADSDQMKAMFPTATPVPYPCNVCGAHDSQIRTQFLDLSQLGSIEQLKSAINQAKLGFLNVPSRIGVHRRKVKRRN